MIAKHTQRLYTSMLMPRTQRRRAPLYHHAADDTPIGGDAAYCAFLPVAISFESSMDSRCFCRAIFAFRSRHYASTEQNCRRHRHARDAHRCRNIQPPIPMLMRHALNIHSSPYTPHHAYAHDDKCQTFAQPAARRALLAMPPPPVPPMRARSREDAQSRDSRGRPPRSRAGKHARELRTGGRSCCRHHARPEFFHKFFQRYQRCARLSVHTCAACYAAAAFSTVLRRAAPMPRDTEYAQRAEHAMFAEFDTHSSVRRHRARHATMPE